MCGGAHHTLAGDRGRRNQLEAPVVDDPVVGHVKKLDGRLGLEPQMLAVHVMFWMASSVPLVSRIMSRSPWPMMTLLVRSMTPGSTGIAPDGSDDSRGRQRRGERAPPHRLQFVGGDVDGGFDVWRGQSRPPATVAVRARDQRESPGCPKTRGQVAAIW